MRPVYLQGRGLISALGGNLTQALATLAAGGVAPQRITLPGGTEWPCFTLPHTGQDWRERARQLACAAAAEAGLSGTGLADRRDIPLFIASSSLNIGAIEIEAHHRLGDSFHCADEVAAWLGWRGPVYIVSSACTSSLQALLAAVRLVGSGAADDAVVLGIELPNLFSISGFAAMQLLTPTRPRPLGAERDGIALGQAVAALHLSAQPARWRMRGGSNIVDGRDPTGAIPETVARMCERALADSGLQPSDIGLIKLQAAGSPANDANELEGMAAAFGTMPPLVTLKAALGHTLGASGAAEIALLTACLESGVWPRADYAHDPALRHQLASARPAAVRYVLADILGFGGGHAAVVIEDTRVGTE
ncbi:MAG TPA: beta-ketoacyl synthase N-terminal-like domain-containing protein [Gallionella sp.]